jgi:hypothetical protein
MDRAVWRYSSSWKGWEFLGIAAREATGVDFTRFNGHLIRPILDGTGGVTWRGNTGTTGTTARSSSVKR